jgi:hypothetical protein
MSFRLASFIQSATEQSPAQPPRLAGATGLSRGKRPARLPMLCRRRDPGPVAQPGAVRF